MNYTIRPGDTIASVTRKLNTDWETLKKNNPAAVGRSAKNGNWIIKAGKTVSVKSDFQQILEQQAAAQPAQQPVKQEPLQSNIASPSPSQQLLQSQAAPLNSLGHGDTLWNLHWQTYQADATVFPPNSAVMESSDLNNEPFNLSSPQNQGVDNSGKEVVASWYGKRHQGQVMANGRRFDMNGATIAHRSLSLGTKVELVNPETGEKANAIVADRGPLDRSRDIDLSYGLAKRLSLAKQGVGNLKMRVL